MDQVVRNKLRNVVTQCRKLLEDSTAQALQGRFGIYATNNKSEIQIEDESRMEHLTGEDRACRQNLLDYLGHIQAIGYESCEALEQLIREIAFTHLNRLCAYKMMEARGLIREAVTRGLKSQGFLFYLADHPEDEKLHNSGQQEKAYRNFLDWLGGTLSEEIGVLFNPNDPANRIYPPQHVMDEVLVLINDGELYGIWSQDEAIGWVYQYFTPKELRDKARKESQAPRNSYELAFRNQFYTPRYVVEFLTDNTLGRIWYEMRKGKTSLKECCHYLIRRPTEVFLPEGNKPPADAKETITDFSQEELLKQPVYISHRPKKDPREIKILDPACGSGHFLLYCFDLLQIIYEEAYDDPDLGALLREDYPALEDLHRAMPGLILRYNLHGIDIDLRATQIAALAVWLRCQRAYLELGLKNGDRPKITRSNIVCAEPMPGEEDMRQEFVRTLDDKLGLLVNRIFSHMKLAGEAGSLLKIEEEINIAIREIYGEHGGMFQQIDEESWRIAEKELFKALNEYAKQAKNGKVFRRHLFADDVDQGLAFVDLSRMRYDVVLMNPPFGKMPTTVTEKLKDLYPRVPEDSYCQFVDRAMSLLNGKEGFVGTITNSSFVLYTDFEQYRQYLLVERSTPLVVDLGAGVLDAYVSTACYIIKPTADIDSGIWVCDARLIEDKDKTLLCAVDETNAGHLTKSVSFRQQKTYALIVGSPLCHWAPDSLWEIVSHAGLLGDLIQEAGVGAAPVSDFFVGRWEVPYSDIGFGKRWVTICNGGYFSPFYRDDYRVIDWEDNGRRAKDDLSQRYPYLKGNIGLRIQRTEWYGKSGICYGKRTDRFNAQPLPKDSIFTFEGISVFPNAGVRIESILGYLNSRFVAYFLNLSCGLHKNDIYVRRLPWTNLSREVETRVVTSTRELINYQRHVHSFAELSTFFSIPPLLCNRSTSIEETYIVWRKRERQRELKFIQLRHNLDKAFETALGVDERLREEIAADQGYDCSCFPRSEDLTRERILEALRAKPVRFRPEFSGDASKEGTDLTRASMNLGIHPESIANAMDKNAIYDEDEFLEETIALISWMVGVVLGNWDIRFATGERRFSELPDPFDALPVCPPGMLQGPDGLPTKPEDISPNYPVNIDWDGILVDDPEHKGDIVRRVREVLEVIWKDHAETIEKEICEIMGLRELRDYFRKPGNGGFWMDHVKHYSKSRRKAPIYWYLRSSKGNYGLWLYYRRLDKDIIFKALLNYVEPKIRLEEDRLNTLRARKGAVGNSGREAKQIEKEIDRQEQFTSELYDFKDRLRRTADLHLDPDINDGVVLNIASLWELVPWNEAKEYWNELLEGKYEWSNIGKQLREKELVRK